MSSIEQPISAEELLGWNEDQFVRFMNTCRSKGTDDTEFDILSVIGIQSLSDIQKEEFSDKLK